MFIMTTIWLRKVDSGDVWDLKIVSSQVLTLVFYFLVSLSSFINVLRKHISFFLVIVW